MEIEIIGRDAKAVEAVARKVTDSRDAASKLKAWQQAALHGETVRDQVLAATGTDSHTVAGDEVMERRRTGGELFLASFSKATPESALRSAGLTDEQIAKIKGSRNVASERKASEHIYRALAELQQAEGKMLRNEAPPISIAAVRQVKDLLSAILS